MKPTTPAMYNLSGKWGGDYFDVDIVKAGVCKLPAPRRATFVVWGAPDILRKMAWECDGYDCMSFSNCKVFTPIPKDEQLCVNGQEEKETKA